MSAIAKRTRNTLFIALYRRAGEVQLPSPVTFLMPARPNLCGLDHNSVPGHATNLAACPVSAAEGRSFWDLSTESGGVVPELPWMGVEFREPAQRRETVTAR